MKTITICMALLLSICSYGQLVVDDFSTGTFDRISVDDGKTTPQFQKGATIAGNFRRVHLHAGDNPYKQLAQAIAIDGKLVFSAGYDLNSKLHLAYGYTKNGAKKLNLDLSSFSKLKIEFEAKGAKTGMYLTMFTNNDRGVYSNHVPEREGKMIFEIPFDEIRKIGKTFTLSDIDHIRFQFDSRSKTGCNMAISKIWFE